MEAMTNESALLKDLLNCCGPEVEIQLAHRRPGEKYQKTIGHRSDDSILRWMDCEVLVFRWEKNKAVQIAVEGIPYD